MELKELSYDSRVESSLFQPGPCSCVGVAEYAAVRAA